ncbi:MAG: PQQ-binding-like beta-propeller repeat protein, partial [Phycisphaerae bacterium]
SGVIVADGILQSGHGACVACMEWVGHIALVPAGKFALNDTSSGTDRLLGGKTTDRNTLAATPQDWTTYRGNNSRSSLSTAKVPSAANVRWIWSPNPSFDMSTELRDGIETSSTQPICLGDNVIFGTAAGSICCLDRKTGAELWNSPTGGRIISSPSFWEGKVYAGSGDGYVYCLNVKDGNLIWRYRVAPVERRIMVYGHLMSAWPINANVLVQPSNSPGRNGAVAYAAAGLITDTGGVVLIALDAQAGKPIWEKRFNGLAKTAPSATGQMAWNNGSLWLHSPADGLFIIDPATANVTPAIDWEKIDTHGVRVGAGEGTPQQVTQEHIRHSTAMTSKGQEIGVLPGGWVVVGGKQFYVNADDVSQNRNQCTFLKTKPDGVPLNADGYPDFLSLPKLLDTSTMPAWDDREIFFPGTNNQPAVLCTGLPSLLGSAIEAHPFSATAAAKNWWIEGLINAIKSTFPSNQQRPALPTAMNREKVLSPLLASNAIVFVHGHDTTWHVSAVTRTDPTILWSVILPAQPTAGGLSMTGVGDVLIPLIDGRVVCVGVP